MSKGSTGKLESQHAISNKQVSACVRVYVRVCVCGYAPLLVNQNGFNISGAVLSGIDL